MWGHTFELCGWGWQRATSGNGSKFTDATQMVLQLPMLDANGTVRQNRWHPAAPRDQDMWPGAMVYLPDASMLDIAPATWEMDDGLWHVIDESVLFLMPQVRVG